MNKMVVLAVLLLSSAARSNAMCETNVVAFGAIANDGQDDSAAFQQALEFLQSEGGGYLAVPAGQYRIDHCLSVWEKGSFSTESDAGRIRLQVRGAGRGQSILVGSDGAGLLRFQTNINGMNLTVRDLTLLADRPDCGPALSVINPELGVRRDRGLVIERVEIGQTAATNSFSMGIYTRGQWRSLVSDVQITGADRLDELSGPEDTVFDEQFYVDGAVRSANMLANRADVGSSTNGLALTRLQFSVFTNSSSALINVLGESTTGVGGLFFAMNNGPDSVVTVPCNDLDRRDALTLTAEFSAYDSQGMAIGFGNDQTLFSGESGDAIWVETAGGTNISENADLSLCVRSDGATTVLETIASHDRTSSLNDTASLSLDRTANTLTAFWLDGSNGEAAFQVWSLSGIWPDGPPELGLVKYEVRGQVGVHGNFPRISETRLTARSPYRMVSGVDFEGFYGGRMVECSVYNAHTAYDWATDGTGEGCSVTDSEADPCRIGVSSCTPGQEPGGNITDCRIVAEQTGVRFNCRRAFRIVDNQIEPASGAETGYADIELLNCQAVKVGCNRFTGTAEDRVHLLIDGHGSEPIPIGAVRSQQIEVYGNEFTLPVADAVQYHGDMIFEVRLNANTVNGGLLQ